MNLSEVPAPVFRAIVALIVGVIAIASVRLGLDAEQTATVLGLVAVAAGESGLRQPPPQRGGPGGPGASTLLVLLALLAAGCSGTLGAARAEGRVGLAPDSHRCQALDDRHAAWTAVAQGAGALAGGTGVATLAELGPDYRAPVAITAVAAGTLAAVAVAVADGSAEAWARECAR